jgi:hypothetical protein
MPKPEPGVIGEALYEAMGFWASEDADNDWTMLAICDAIARTCFEPVYQVVGEGPNGEAGWTLRLDPDNGPVDGLPFLAQWVGAVLTAGMDEIQRREEVREPTGWARGRLPSITLITKRELTGEKWIRIRPRTPGPGQIYIRVLASECQNPDRVEAELLEHGIPAWEKLDFEAIEGVTWTDVESSPKFADFDALTAAFADFTALEQILPDEL